MSVTLCTIESGTVGHSIKKRDRNCQDSQFRHLQGTLDSLFHKLHSEGVGVQVRHTELITKLDEEKMWTSGVMGVSCSFLHCGENV